MSRPSSAGAVVIDANVLISLCTKEPLTFTRADAAFNNYAQKGWTYYAPNVIVAEAMFVICRKLQDGQLTDIEHAESIEFLTEETLLCFRVLKRFGAATVVLAQPMASTLPLPKSWPNKARPKS